LFFVVVFLLLCLLFVLQNMYVNSMIQWNNNIIRYAL
jgi:hypothetical protein